MSKTDKITVAIILCLVVIGIVMCIVNNSNKETVSVSTNDEIVVSSVDEIPTTIETVTELTETEPLTVESIETPNNSQIYFSDYERWVTECMVMGEAGGESYEGQVLVAQCIFNACEIDDLTPSEVRTAFQYSGWNDYPSDSVKKAVSAVFDEGYKITDEPILYFYAYTWSTSGWHETQRFVIEEGSHRFFARW